MAGFKRGTRVHITWPGGAKLELIFESTSKARVAEALATWQAAQPDPGTAGKPAMLGFKPDGSERIDHVDGITLYIQPVTGSTPDPVPVGRTEAPAARTEAPTAAGSSAPPPPAAKAIAAPTPAPAPAVPDDDDDDDWDDWD